MELLLIRHAVPIRVENTGGRPAGPPLSEIGREQAGRLAEWLEPERVDALYASPMRRAYETTVPFAERAGLEIRIEEGVVGSPRVPAGLLAQVRAGAIPRFHPSRRLRWE
jgi:probable phosphoglycerate mutase